MVTRTPVVRTTATVASSTDAERLSAGSGSGEPAGRVGCDEVESGRGKSSFPALSFLSTHFKARTTADEEVGQRTRRGCGRSRGALRMRSERDPVA